MLLLFYGTEKFLPIKKILAHAAHCADSMQAKFAHKAKNPVYATEYRHRWNTVFSPYSSRKHVVILPYLENFWPHHCPC